MFGLRFAGGHDTSMTRFLFLASVMALLAWPPAHGAVGNTKDAPNQETPAFQVYEISGIRMKIPVGYLRDFE